MELEGDAMIEKDGGPAFPIRGMMTDEDENNRAYGMTLRDYFAAQALTMLTKPENDHHNPKIGWQRTLAWAAYSMADAMLVERERERPNNHVADLACDVCGTKEDIYKDDIVTRCKDHRGGGTA